MSTFLVQAIAFTLGCYAVSSFMVLSRLVRGPRAQDRVLGLDSLSVNVLLMMVTVGIRTGSSLYFEAALVIALLSFASTVAMAKFLMRGEVIE